MSTSVRSTSFARQNQLKRLRSCSNRFEKSTLRYPAVFAYAPAFLMVKLQKF